MGDGVSDDLAQFSDDGRASVTQADAEKVQSAERSKRRDVL